MTVENLFDVLISIRLVMDQARDEFLGGMLTSEQYKTLVSDLEKEAEENINLYVQEKKMSYQEEMDLAVASYTSTLLDNAIKLKRGEITQDKYDIITHSVNRRFVKIIRQIKQKDIQKTVEFLKHDVDNMDFDPAKL